MAIIFSLWLHECYCRAWRQQICHEGTSCVLKLCPHFLNWTSKQIFINLVLLGLSTPFKNCHRVWHMHFGHAENKRLQWFVFLLHHPKESMWLGYLVHWLQRVKEQLQLRLPSCISAIHIIQVPICVSVNWIQVIQLKKNHV